MDKELKVAIARNLLEEKTCNPNSIKGSIISEFPMEKNRDSIFYIKPEHKDDNTKNS